jgi:hypothetical protein
MLYQLNYGRIAGSIVRQANPRLREETRQKIAVPEMGLKLQLLRKRDALA